MSLVRSVAKRGGQGAPGPPKQWALATTPEASSRGPSDFGSDAEPTALPSHSRCGTWMTATASGAVGVAIETFELRAAEREWGAAAGLAVDWGGLLVPAAPPRPPERKRAGAGVLCNKSKLQKHRFCGEHHTVYCALYKAAKKAPEQERKIWQQLAKDDRRLFVVMAEFVERNPKTMKGVRRGRVNWAEYRHLCGPTEQQVDTAIVVKPEEQRSLPMGSKRRRMREVEVKGIRQELQRG